MPTKEQLQSVSHNIEFSYSTYELDATNSYVHPALGFDVKYLLVTGYLWNNDTLDTTVYKPILPLITSFIPLVSPTASNINFEEEWYLLYYNTNNTISEACRFVTLRNTTPHISFTIQATYFQFNHTSYKNMVLKVYAFTQFT